jgi:hypothetical protein
MMRNSTRLIFAATLLLAAPVAAQEAVNVTATNDAAAAGPELGTMNNLDSDAAIATGTTNGLTAGPGAAPATDPLDQPYAEPAPEREDGRFPWGLLGLLGLAGLIPRKPRPRADGRDLG